MARRARVASEPGDRRVGSDDRDRMDPVGGKGQQTVVLEENDRFVCGLECEGAALGTLCSGLGLGQVRIGMLK